MPKNSGIFRCIFLGTIFFVHAALAETPPYTPVELDQIQHHLLNNIARPGHQFKKWDEGREIHSMPGAVIASPSNKSESFSQDYQFHWTRDAAITMKEVLYLYMHSKTEEKQQFYSYLLNYINFEKKAQKQSSRHGEETLGQPKFNIDGTVWEGEWARPQNDGPALRAITIIAIATALINESKENWVKENLVDMIRLDLDYLVRHWKTPNYCLWEEVKDADHFFHKMVQRKALLDGYTLLRHFSDEQRLFLYIKTADEIGQSLQRHWSEGRGYFSETVNQTFFKGGGLNASILLGALYGNLHDETDPFALTNDRIMSSVFYLRNLFANLYRINLDTNAAPLLGRYGNDIYDGNQFEYGNPWVLISHAMAEYYYELANHYQDLGKINISQRNLLFFRQIKPDLVDKPGEITLQHHGMQFNNILDALRREGDHYLESIKTHAECYTDNTCYHFAEQIDRTNGKSVSAKDLTWGYTSLLSALQTRR